MPGSRVRSPGQRPSGTSPLSAASSSLPSVPGRKDGEFALPNPKQGKETGARLAEEPY